jgi:hypothetical protein
VSSVTLRPPRLTLVFARYELFVDNLAKTMCDNQGADPFILASLYSVPDLVLLVLSVILILRDLNARAFVPDSEVHLES